MRKFLCLVLSMSIISIGSISCAVGYYCPTESEYRAKQNSFMQKASNPSLSKSDFLRISNESEAYDLSVFNNCLGYLKTTPNPDCSKVSMLQNGYFSQEIISAIRKDDIKAAPSIDGNLIVNTDSGLSVALPNNLILTTDEDDKTHFGTQPIGQINYDSEDLIGGNYNGK